MDIRPSYLPASTSTSISVSDLIQSGRLSSNTQFLLQDEEEECINSSTAAPAGRRTQALSATAAGLDGRKARQRQRMENAARVALCLARAFDKFRTHLNNVAEEKNIIPYSNILLTMLELGDFNIELIDRKRNRMCYDHQNEVPSHDDNDSITAELINTCSRSSHRRCRPIQGAFSSNDHQPNVADVASKSTILSIWTRTDTLLECLLSRLNNPSSSPERQQPSSICDSTPLQVLGKLLYVVFSQGGHYEHSLLSRPEVTSLCQEERDVHSMLVARSSKKRCSESRTLFTSLVESDLFPASICRLLSDMMRATHNNSEGVSSRGSDDDDDYGSHHAPFTSFEGVIQDLEQMVNEPLIFLHNTRSSDTNIGDCGSPISTRLPIFGERYFGRKEEVTRLIEISTNMEARASSKEKEASKEALNAVFVSGVAGSGKVCGYYIWIDTSPI